MLVDIGEPEWAAYFSAFNQQLVPTDDLGLRRLKQLTSWPGRSASARA